MKNVKKLEKLIKEYKGLLNEDMESELYKAVDAAIVKYGGSEPLKYARRLVSYLDRKYKV